MQSKVDIQDIIKRLMAGQPVDGYAFSPGGSWEGGDAGSWVPNANGLVSQDLGNERVNIYGQDGKFQYEDQQNKHENGLKQLAMMAAMAASAGSLGGLFGASSLGAAGVAGMSAAEQIAFLAANGMTDAAIASAFPSLGAAGGLTGIGGGLGAAAAAFDAGSGLETGSTFSGNGGFDALTKGFSALPEVATAGTALGATAAPLAMADLGIGSALTSMAAAPSFLDKLGTWASDPANLLKGVGTIGGLYEAFNGKDPGDFTQTTNKTLDPRIDSAMFGPGGLLGQIKDFGTANPGGMNDAMRTGQNGLLGMASNPGVLDGFNRLGANGLGLLGRGIATNPWLTKAGG